MLQRAAQVKSPTDIQAKGADSDEEGWSDDEQPSSLPSPPAAGPTILSPGERLPSGAIVKQAVTKPPEVSRRPPPKPAPLVSESAASPTNPPVSVSPILSPPASMNPSAMLPPQPQSEAVGESKTSDRLEPAGSSRPAPAPPSESHPPAASSKERSRSAELDEEIQLLRRKLERAESRLSQKEGTAGSLSREVALEKELDDAHDKLSKLRLDKAALEESVKELQMKLLEAETASPVHSPMRTSELGEFFSPSPGRGAALLDPNSIEASVRRGEREKQLEMLLLKTKRDKDKAIRLIIQIVGKDRISSFLTRHAGTPDILDRLLEYFATGLQISESSVALSPASPTHRSKSSGRSTAGGSSKEASMKGSTIATDHVSASGRKSAQPKSPAHYRSRIDEYYRTVITSRDL